MKMRERSADTSVRTTNAQVLLRPSPTDALVLEEGDLTYIDYKTLSINQHEQKIFAAC